jgi:hypothetical protein
MGLQLNDRWTELRPHAVQNRLIKSSARHNVVPAGRRSGKSEIIGKRKIVLCALNAHRKDLPFFYRPHIDPRFFVAAPTRDQAKRIYWQDLKAMIPKQFIAGKANESFLYIPLINGSQIWVLGLDKPERAEGTPWDGGVLDEYGNMKKDVWTHHIQPALADRDGWCDFIGVPEGRNHYYDLYKSAQEKREKALREGRLPEWDTFTWFSADILPPEKIEQAKEDLDELTFKQEYEASFVNFTGRAYWAFTEQYNIGRLEYDPHRDLELCFDFNVDPGIAVIVQEQYLSQKNDINGGKEWGDGIIGEVYIPRGSNTMRVVDKLIEDWKDHQGNFRIYGDYTGGARGSAKIKGSDWEIIKWRLLGTFKKDRLFFDVKPNPRERDRVNSVNSRIKTMSGKIKMMIDPSRAPRTIKDFEGVTVIEGSAGELDKKSNPELTHLSDAYGYRVYRKYPLKKKFVSSGQQYIR